MSWYALDHMAWERTRELEAAAAQPRKPAQPRQRRPQSALSRRSRSAS